MSLFSHCRITRRISRMGVRAAVRKRRSRPTARKKRERRGKRGKN